jgi:mono/diheme cytochrome c family protein
MLRLFFLMASVVYAQKYGVGRPAAAPDIAAKNYSVSARGEGLPPGGGSAKEGEELYVKHCSTCHGPKLQGDGEQGYPAIAGGIGTLASPKPVKTVGSYWPYATGVFDYVRRAMPYDNPRTLKPDEYYAVTAYVLFVNGIVKQNERLDATSLPQVKMPNRDGFFIDPRVTGKRPAY